MANLTLSANMDTLLTSADFAAARTNLGLSTLATTSPGTGVATALGVNVGSAGAFVVLGGALGTPTSGTLTNATGLPISTGVSGLGTGVAGALAISVGSAGAPVILNGAGGTPSSLTLTNATGLPLGSVTGLGTGVSTALAVNVGTSGAFIVLNGAGGTPTSITLTNANGLPVGGLSATGTPSATTYLRGDGTWNTPPGGGDVTAAANFGTDNLLLRSDGTGKGCQASAITCDDSGNVTGIGSLTGTSLQVTTFGILDTNASHELRLVCGSDLTAHRNLTFTTGDSPRTVTLNGDVTLNAGTAVVSGGALGTPSSGALTNCTADGTDAVGFRNVPANSQSAAYTAVLADAGKSIDHPSTDANARTFTIPANASVAYPVGTCLSFSNMTSQVVTIAITTDTLYLAGTGSTGSRSLAQYGVATARKITSTAWLINGTGLT